MFKKHYVKQCQVSMYIFLVISESWKFVRFHEILYHKDAENFSFLSWRASARDFTVLYSSKVLPVKIYKLDSYLPIIRHWLPALHCAVWYNQPSIIGMLKFMFSKKATKIDKNLHRQFDIY